MEKRKNIIILIICLQITIPFVYANREWGFVPTVDRPEAQELRLHGVSLSRAGKELLKIVDVEPIEAYTTALQEYFETQNLRMVELKKP